MGRLGRVLGWPWRFLQDTDVLPLAVQVAESIQPTLDVGQHFAQPVKGYRETFTMAAGTNTVVLPGPGRAATLNAGLPNIRTNGARRWCGITWRTDTVLAAGDNLLWAYGGLGANWTFFEMLGTTAFPAGQNLPILNGIKQSSALVQLHGMRGSLLVADPNFIFFTLASQVGGEILTLSGSFIESETLNQPLPSPFS